MGRANSAAHLAEYRWEPGVSPNPAGRPKGSRSKLQEEVIRALYENFAVNGAEAIETVRKRKPEVYLMACVSLLPKQAQKVESPFTDISDAELEALETHLAAVRAKMVQTIDGTATDAPATTPQPHKTASEDAEKDTAASILDRAQRNVDDAA